MPGHPQRAPKVRPGFPARLGTVADVLTPHQQAPSASAQSRVAPVGVGLDSSAVRRSMIAKLAQQGLADARVQAALTAVERHRFVDSALVNQAYEDTSLPIGLGQTISKPSVVARMIALLLEPVSGKLGRVLEVGTGCGYQAALLSQVCTEVYSIERLRGLHEKARDNLRHLRLANVHLLFGDGMLGYPKGAPYAGIIAAAGGDQVPACWLEQLAVGGRLVAPVVSVGTQQALLVADKTPQGMVHTLLELVHFVPLKSGVA
ncbi:MAG: protein-L-isoaspartate(D-aspartate) O-methyltransferase [Rhodoferax sp.]|nr:protein-L-isoaspartate(D-aspartate) O-methyltransferase [Rhodoferax sp.]